MTDTYKLKEIERAEKNHEKKYPFHIVISGTENKTNHLNISHEELEKIKDIFR